MHIISFVCIKMHTCSAWELDGAQATPKNSIHWQIIYTRSRKTAEMLKTSRPNETEYA
jgi:hypothetical protein